jgi:hypothetical protein
MQLQLIAFAVAATMMGAGASFVESRTLSVCDQQRKPKQQQSATSLEQHVPNFRTEQHRVMKFQCATNCFSSQPLSMASK